MKKLVNIFIVLLMSLNYGCSDYLDVIPDNLATLDIVFNNKTTAEKYLFNCYSFVPEYGNLWDNPGLSSGHEVWYYTEKGDARFSNNTSWGIARGLQNTTNPLTNYWDGEQGAKPMFRAIRECNIFLEYVRDRKRVPDLSDSERKRWIAEVNILKAFYHYYLFHLYGPIPITDTYVPVSASQEEVKVTRVPVDKVVEYMVKLIDDSYNNLPPKIFLPATEMGRLTQPAALAIKAKILLWAASPLFNGNTDYANFRNKEGEHLINQTYSREKWVSAMEACHAAIKLAEQNGHALYDFSMNAVFSIPDEIHYAMNIRQAVTERFNAELIWSVGKQGTGALQRNSMACVIPALNQGKVTGAMLQACATGVFAPTIETAERFYSANGVPINEDLEWINKGYYNNRYSTQQVPNTEKYNLKSGFTTAVLNFNREPRFYGSLGFDGSTWYGNGWKDANDENSKNYVDAKSGKNSGDKWATLYSATGYFAKKLVHYENEITNDKQDIKEYPFPIVRLADLYLMYIEALNESTEGEEVNPEVYEYLKRIRERSGLKKGLFGQTEDIGDVRVAWEKYSNDPTKPLSKGGIREIIKHERQIELALEGQQYHDLRRWKDATKELSKPVKGWNVHGKTEEEYYKITVLYNAKAFTNKEYLWPIKDHDLQIDNKLIQTYGW
ncbi:RagB/SusD family nutrient uptake outer membrane protein [Bacteroides sp. 224]|uniref:RagB/SusD family nutrient uptake outer membrane protein n=1 Tax=Bacteroides sp. 224 TaxID=2302936 RepID=UPI0013D28CAE|nr:RagB/SusD family nutrient uptake outer membrane protein [Bacteroides sp. 224]NDV65280.1 RagB/SusD family nutrient uptake outer membrane protein [Bacteroides sp. 224]